MRLDLSLIQKVSSSNRGEIPPCFSISEVFIDSRLNVNEGLFVPIIGERFDGHSFLETAIQNGAVAALWQKSKQLPTTIDETFPVFFVDDTLQALQQLATFYRQEINPIVIGVTGSNGKTTTKDILESVLAKKYKTHKTKGNFNNHIGLPLTILSMPVDCELLILEMGMSGYGEISLLSKLAQPDFAVVTNIGESHIEQLGSREGIAKAKMEITDGLKPSGYVVIDGDEPLLIPYVNERAIRCGHLASNDVVIQAITSIDEGVTFQLNNEKDQFVIPLLGNHNVKNAVYAITIARKLHLDDSLIKSGLIDLQLTGMRLERLQGLNGALLINDAYNASPTSMKAAIETVKQLQGYERKVLVLGDMYELGVNEEQLHRDVADVILAPITNVITIGQKGKWIAEALETQGKARQFSIDSFHSKDEALPVLKTLLDEKTVVLFKASRGLKLETVIETVSY
ncbi:UDP-N-acetylmuramoyl-tripeptide--D-alanyl-D-alanine ligase [Anaerobacillus sp. MEB173]|uniref:UDP-N-acetylmuramoyl-tripeptide--D-alanyl-D- alanine ligase n=1 Tax=Anaerobacillus sp. MEB173 TaxID=3383345 RepID=UPI003F931C47